MNFKEFYVANNAGKSNCVIRTFCKMYNEEYDNVYNELCAFAKELNRDSFNDIEVFETYMKNHNTNLIDYGKDIKIKDLKLDNGSYAIFCSDKKDFYHMVTVIDNVLYDKNDESFELYVNSIYKQNI